VFNIIKYAFAFVTYICNGRTSFSVRFVQKYFQFNAKIETMSNNDKKTASLLISEFLHCLFVPFRPSKQFIL